MPATITVVDGITIIQAGENTALAQAAAATATLAQNAAAAAGNYFPSQAAGEAGTTTGEFFSYPDGAGGLIYAERTGGGSTVIAEAATSAQVALKANQTDLTELSVSAGSRINSAVAIASSGSNTAISASASAAFALDAVYAALLLDYDQDAIDYIEANGVTDLAARHAINNLVAVVKANATWADVAIALTTSRHNTLTGANLPSLGGWTTNPLVLTGSPTVGADGIDFGASNTTKYGTWDLTGLKTATALSVFLMRTPYAKGVENATNQYLWTFGAVQGSKYMGLLLSSGSFSGESIAYQSNTNRSGASHTYIRGERLREYMWGTQQQIIDVSRFSTAGLSAWWNDQSIAIALGSSSLVADWSPNDLGYTADDTFRLGYAISGGGSPTAHMSAKVQALVAIKGAVTDHAAIAQALMQLEEAFDAWNAPTGREDAQGVYEEATGLLTAFGGDNGLKVLNSIFEIDTATGERTVLSATLPAAKCMQGCAHDKVGRKVYLTHGRDPYAVTYFGGVYIYDLKKKTISTSAFTDARAVGQPAVEWSAANGCAYAFGGQNAGGFSAAISKFVPATGWTTLAAVLPQGTTAIASAVVPGAGSAGGDAIFLFGGTISGSSPYDTDAILKFDCDTETIADTGDALTGVIDSARAVYDPDSGLIAVFGGYNGGGTGSGTYQDRIDLYDWAAGTVTASADTLWKPMDDYVAAYESARSRAWIWCAASSLAATNNDVTNQMRTGYYSFDDDETVEL